MSLRINSKAEMYKRYVAGEFGNTPVLYRSYYHALFSGNMIAVRYAGDNGGGLCTIVPYRELGRVSRDWMDIGLKMECMKFSEALPDRNLLLQGEVVSLDGILYLRYNETPGISMRMAMQNSCHASGHRAEGLLKRVMSRTGWLQLHVNLARFPGAVVEFASYSVPCGVLGDNTVFFEVRHY